MNATLGAAAERYLPFFPTESVLTVLEKVSDESFWQGLLGQRALQLVRRYFGSDVVLIGAIVYTVPVIHSYFTFLTEGCMKHFQNHLYVTVKISESDPTYTTIHKYVMSQVDGLEAMRDVVVCSKKGVNDDDDEDDDDNDDIVDTLGPQLQLRAPVDREHIIYYKGRKLWVVSSKETASNSHTPWGGTGNDLASMLSRIRSEPCLNITMRSRNVTLLKEILQEWVTDHHQKKFDKLTIWRCGPCRYDTYDWFQVGTKQLRSIDSVILKDGQTEHILRDIQTFLRRKQWYADRGIPYRRGYLLHGPPGTGKTSLVQSIAGKINKNVGIMSLSGQISDDEFLVLLREAPANSILVIEDVDHCTISDGGVTSSDSTKTPVSKVTMSGMLNALDGVTAHEGTMIFMTCNDMNKLQPALLRPGRIDVKMELGYADESQIRRMFERFVSSDDADLSQRFSDLIPPNTVTTAELQNFFIMHMDDIYCNIDETQDNSRLFTFVPEFLESVEKDRSQAKLHKEAKEAK